MKSENVVSLRTGLAGAVALAAGTSAYAGIVQVAVPADILPPLVPGTSAPSNWDVDGNGTVDFNFTFRNPGSATQVRWQANMNRNTTNNTSGGTVAYLGGFGLSYGFNLAANTNIGPSSTFQNGGTGGQVILGSVYAGLNYGGFGTGGNPRPGPAQPGASRGFAGFSFNTPGGLRYGWIELETTETLGIRFLRAAYEDSGAAIPAGVPTPGTLGALAIGAAAMLRRNRKSA